MDDIRIKKNAERLQLFMISSAIGIGMVGYLLMSRLFSKVLGSIYNSLDDETYFRLAESSIFQNAIYLIYAILCVVLPFVLVRFIIKYIMPSKLLYNKPKKNSKLLPLMFIGLGLCVLGNYATVIFSMFTEVLFKSIPTGAPSDVTSASQISFVGFLVSVVSTAVMPALAEEFALRGVVMQPLRKFGDKFAVVISALIFSIIHGNFEQIPFSFVVGLALGYVVIRTNSIWAGVLLHFLNNFWAVCSEYLSYLVPQTVRIVIYHSTNLLICIGAIISAVYLYEKDVKSGITEGVLEKAKCCMLSKLEKTILVIYSPTLLIGVGYFLYSALQKFVAV